MTPFTDNRGKNWLPEHYRLIKDLFIAGTSLQDIARRSGRTPVAVVSKLSELGLITIKGRDYHKVDPDPWMSWTMLKIENEEFEANIKSFYAKSKEPQP